MELASNTLKGYLKKLNTPLCMFALTNLLLSFVECVCMCAFLPAWERRLQLVTQLGGAVWYLHQKNIFHSILVVVWCLYLCQRLCMCVRMCVCVVCGVC